MQVEIAIPADLRTALENRLTQAISAGGHYELQPFDCHCARFGEHAVMLLQLFTAERDGYEGHRLITVHHLEKWIGNHGA